MSPPTSNSGFATGCDRVILEVDNLSSYKRARANEAWSQGCGKKSENLVRISLLLNFLLCLGKETRKNGVALPRHDT
jgi:hypothetical protein